MTDDNKNTNLNDKERLERTKNRFEIYNTLILSIATLFVTWCSYQSTLWGGIQTFKLEESNLANRHAQEKSLMTVQMQTMDESVIVAFAQDVVEKKQYKIDFYIQRLRPGLSNVLKAWLATNPIENPSAPAHPMMMKEYKALYDKDMVEVNRLSKQGDLLWSQAEQANTYSDRYSLFTVVFSMIMFLGAITTKLTRLLLSFILIVGSGIICIVLLFILFLYMPLA